MNELLNNQAAGGARLSLEQSSALEQVGQKSMTRVSQELGKLLRRPVEISVPQVHVDTTGQVLEKYQIPFVIVEYAYRCALESKAFLLLKEPDVLQIAGILSGEAQAQELGPEHMPVVSEVSNLMVSASAVAIAEELGSDVDFTEPVANLIDLELGADQIVDIHETVAVLTFVMEIEGMPKSSLLLLLPVGAAGEFADLLIKADAPVAPAAPEAPPRQPAPAAQPQAPVAESQPAAQGRTISAPSAGGMVNVSPVQYPAFGDTQRVAADAERGLNLVYDIPLAVTVELGKTKKNISEILELGVGSIFTLDKMAGEPVEIMANGKLIARGDVVVIDENYGVRITDIVSE